MYRFSTILRFLRCYIVAGALVALGSSEARAEETQKVLFQQRLPRVPAYVIAEATVAGKPSVVLLDTHAGSSALDDSRTDAVRFELRKKNILASDGTMYPMMTYAGHPIKLGGITIDRPTVVISDLSAFSIYTGRPLDGVIGMRVMEAGKIFLNYDEGIFQIHVGPWKLNKPDCTVVDLSEAGEAPEFNTEILGQRVSFCVDTGHNGCIELESKVFEALVQQGCIEPAKVDARGISIGGMNRATQGWFLKGELMGKNLAGVRVDSNPTLSILGLEWLYGFNTEIDFGDRKLRYQLRRDAKLPGSVHVMLGAILKYDSSGAQIERLRASGGAAADAGLKPGDVIEKFGGLNAKGMNAASMGEAVADAAGKEIAVRFLRKADGEHVDTKLKLPPNISEWDFSGRDVLNRK